MFEGKEDFPFYKGGKYVRGKLHWDGLLTDKREIVSFDLNSYEYGVVELPSFVMGDEHRLGVVEGCLSVHCIPREALFAIGLNGEVLLAYDSTFMIYNPEGLIVLQHPRYNDDYLVHNIGIYIESLASVVPDEE
ncbi:hypothetical protein ACS0TY_004937 [Phlomoides rotata]